MKLKIFGWYFYSLYFDQPTWEEQPGKCVNIGYLKTELPPESPLLAPYKTGNLRLV
jgi:hypothetical protein